ncbi:MAG: signal recognition particle-docking protein FtsY [Candidatus Xenolissoclinum pacificiensis L6]|uniref:Signal recognition particle-docking protein FtsY n=1 Tax=Candidatus Xenolissoclinum pacificiensis L6 TaxID=1401685 RepID=W2UYA5_9RICK|nr:MAG: signal recognition particle-docking protein FtsY [Candidatus Xenolissoclinum pacificiensis L6]
MLKNIFRKVRSSVIRGKALLSGEISRIFSKNQTKDEVLENLYEVLIRCDVGTQVAERLISQVKVNKDLDEVECKKTIKSVIKEILENSEGSLSFEGHNKTVILLCGINGNGKTTSICKLVHLISALGKNIVIAAADTFRIAAQEQLSTLTSGYKVHFEGAKKEYEDPGSVVYRASQVLLEKEYDVLIIDTAGRLHTSSDLMQQLKKITGIVDKVLPDAIKHNIICLDANNGQNVLNQVRDFKGYIQIDGAIVTKVDGYAKGGIIVNIVDIYSDFKIYYLGNGEGESDIIPFRSHQYIDYLLSD